MSAPNTNQVRYPIQAQPPAQGTSAASAGAALSAKFPAVPTGMVWTVGILLSFPPVGTGSGVQLADFNTLQWQVVRNGIPEFTWVGNAMVKDLQLIASDTVELWAFNTDINAPYPSQNPESAITCLMQGLGQSINDYVPTSPSLFIVPTSAADDDLPYTANFGTTTVADGSANLDLNVFGTPANFVRLTNLLVSAGVIAAATGPIKGEIQITDQAAAETYFRMGLATATSGYANLAIDVPFNRMPLSTNPAGTGLPGSPLKITWTGFSTATGWRLDVVARMAAY